MEISAQLVISALGGFGILGILFYLFRFIVVKFFQNLIDTQTELIKAKNDLFLKTKGHCERISNIEDDIREIKSDYKSLVKFKQENN